MTRIIEIINTYISLNFWGEVTIKFSNGEITVVETLRTEKLN